MSSEPGYSRQSSIRFVFRVAAVGGWLATAGFGSAAARYAVGEGAPVARDALDHLTRGQGLDNLGRTRPDPEPTGGPYCRACGTRNAAAASLCDACGKSLA